MDEEKRILWPWLKRGYSWSEARKIRSFINDYKTRLAREPNSASSTWSADKLNKQRYARNKTQLLRKKYTRGRLILWDKEALAKSSYISEPILDGLVKDRNQIWKSPFDRSVAFNEVSIDQFSFLEDPVKAISHLQRIAYLETFITHGRLNFNDLNCLDVGPYLILQEMRKGMLPVFRGGRISPSVQSVLDVVSLRRPLQMDFKSKTRDAVLWPLLFRQRSGQNRTPERLLYEQTSEAAAAEVTEKINEWLSMLANLELSDSGEALILKFIGETLNNAERHSISNSIEGYWCIAGFMSRHKEGNGEAYRCHLSFLSKGQTIHESMSTSDETTKKKMGYYIKRHVKRFMRPGFTEENLTTVYALQDGVSRVSTALDKGRGGMGFMDMLDFFAALGVTEREEWLPQFSIVSGRTCVRIMPPHITGIRRTQTPGADGLLSPRELWFNQANSQSAPPDTRFVFDLPAKLQGTLVTVAWTFDKASLESIINDRN